MALLQKHGIAVSMTEDYKPTDNAVAERINGIIKAESSHPRGRFNEIGHARNVIARYIHFYNHRRPHMSIGYKIPATSSNEKKDAISLQSRTSKYGFCKSSKMTVNRIRTTHFAVSTISAGLGKKWLLNQYNIPRTVY
ncbi:integrase core domain-containing protein [Bacteroides uniformis]|uniref:integrase core domain-containing protein n=1 Tax=Bacteroides uniformis TaxID=820 RepID=UPI001C021518